MTLVTSSYGRGGRGRSTTGSGGRGGTLQAPVAQEAQVTSSYDGRYSTGSYGTGGALQLTGSGGDS